MKRLDSKPRADILADMRVELVAHRGFMDDIGRMDPLLVAESELDLLRCLPSMLKQPNLTSVQMADVRGTYGFALETFLRKHKSWKKSKGVGNVRSRRSKRRTDRLSAGSDTESDQPSRKVASVTPFARPFMPISDITARSIAKGKALVNAFDAWKTGTDKILPMRAVKFIGKHVASPVSRFQHPTRGVYHVLSATAQVEQRDNKLRNIFESVARDLVPGRETRKLEYEAAELLRDKGGKIAKDRRKRRGKGETKLLARLALECELCLMGSKSWSAYDKALKSDGVVDAIRTSLVRSDDSDSDSDANTVSLKTATAACLD
jgi:hypothetical protein